MKKQTILIVDDESTNISVLVEILCEKYNLLVATDGTTALEIVNSNEEVDLILLDILMPKMNGYEVAYQLKHTKKTSKIPFIFLTAKSDSKSVVKGFLEGAVDYISKPFAKEELLARVHNHLQFHTLNSELFQNKNFLQSVLDYSTHAIITTDTNGTITLFNRAAQLMLGYSSRELVGKKSPAIFHDINEIQERADEFSKELNTKIEVGFDVFVAKSREGFENTHEWKYITKNKKTIIVNLAVSALRDDAGEIIGYIGIAEDITQKKRDEKKIAQYLEIMDKNIISSSTDLDGTIVEVSEAFCKLTGYSREELIGKSHNILRHVDIKESAYKIMWETIINNEIWKGEVKNRRKDGSLYWVNATVFPLLDDEDTKIGYMAIRQDITDKKRIEELSIMDELTKLYNRRYFNEVFASELNRAKRENKSISFLMLDVDYFKLYNDTYGHQEGDSILSKIGEVLNTFSKRAGDFAFRLGGEEFGIIVHEDSPEEVLKFANNLLKAIEALNIPHAKNLVSKFVTVSIGLVYKNIDKTTTVETLYKEVDECLYRAKESGRNRLVSS
ncbi:MAG: diguanylate cyclase [Campylobacterales bacterium]|nr:diguanylate cyclase [Campylobacterales bacterium]